MKKTFEKHIIMSGFWKKGRCNLKTPILMKAAIYFCEFKNFADLKNLLNKQWSSLLVNDNFCQHYMSYWPTFYLLSFLMSF